MPDKDTNLDQNLDPSLFRDQHEVSAILGDNPSTGDVPMDAGVAAKNALTSEKAVGYLAKSRVEGQPNHFKSLLPEIILDENGEIEKLLLILSDPAGKKWHDDEINAIKQAVGENVELAYLGKDGKAISLDSPESDLARIQSIDDKGNCGSLVAQQCLNWNAGIRGKALFGDIDPEVGATEEQVEKIRDGQDKIIELVNQTAQIKQEREGADFNGV